MSHALLILALFAQTQAASPTPTPTPTEPEEQTDAVAEHQGIHHPGDRGLSPAVIAKLSGEQIHDIMTHTDHDPPAVPAVAVIAVVGFFLSATLTVFGVLFAIYRVYRQRSETLRLMVEKGVQIPPELISPAPKPQQDLRRGLVLSMFGLGLGVFLAAVASERGMWTLGLIPLLVGVGYIVAARVTKPVTA